MKTKLPSAKIEASERSAAPLNPLMVGKIVPVGLVALRLMGKIVTGEVEDRLVMDRVEVVVFSATILVVEKLP